MRRGVIHTLDSFQLERHLQRSLELVVHLDVEVIDVARPVSSERCEPILPSSVSASLLPIVEEVIREHAGYPAILAEHEHSSVRRPQNPFCVFSGCAEKRKEVIVACGIPDVSSLDRKSVV